ncbi:SurA N-terminal domain-containing protein [Cereibacter sp. SYSU M97828]|nr:SurA N-terminal domain-containing protein [Cereibacter flavus]
MATKKSKTMSVVVWGIVGVMVVGGFGMTGLGGTVTSIGSVGSQKIDTNTYARALQQELQNISQQTGQPMTLAQARQFGLDQQVRQRLISAAALADEADRIGLSVGDATLAQEIRGNRAFSGTAGQFDRDTYAMVLRQNGLTEATFEDSLRTDIARGLLVGATAGGFTAPAALTDTLYNYIGERRGFSLLRLTEADLAEPIAAPTDADLQAFYDAHIADFTAPEARRVTYAALIPEELAPTLPVEDAALRALYDQRIDEFVQPERRLVERLVFPDQAAAEAAKARIDAGESFETIVAERGLELMDVDMGDVAPADLGEAGDAVFALADPGVVGPFNSNLGPALFRMNGVLAAHEVTFDEAREDLATEYQLDTARREIGARVQEFEDALADGATIEDLGGMGMRVATVDVSDATEDQIAGYPAFRNAANEAQQGDFPEIFQLDDGGLAALRLDEIVPPAPIPLDDVRDRVTEGWRSEKLHAALAARAAEAQADGNLGAYGLVDVTQQIARDGTVAGAPDTLIPTLFTMEPNEVRTIEGPEFVGVVRLDSIQPAATDGEAAAALKGAISAQAEDSLANDAQALFTQAVADQAGIRLDQAAIDAVHAQIP